MPLDVKAAMKLDNEMQMMNKFMNLVMKNPEIKGMLMKEAENYGGTEG